MKKLLLAGVAGCALLGAASAGAADLPARRMAPLPAPVPVFTWTGAYIGLNVGGIEGDHIFDPVSSTYLAGPAVGTRLNEARFTSRGDTEIIGGIQTGYRVQFGSVVLGFEQDAQFTDLKSESTFGTSPTGFGFASGDSFSARLSYLGATRGTIGFAFDRFMIYAAGGLMTGIMDVSGSYVASGGAGSPAGTFTEKNKFHIGYTIGGGAEYAITNNVSIGVDYRYFELQQERYNLGAVVSRAGTTYTNQARVEFEGHQLLGRLNLKTSGLFGIF